MLGPTTFIVLMETFAITVALAISVALTAFCWRRILRSDDHRFFKIFLCVSTVVPFLGPLFYFFTDTPPRHIHDPRRAKRKVVVQRAPSLILQQWNEREHIYLTWAGLVFVSLAVLSWYINDWTPGQMHFGALGVFTDVDVIFFALLLLAIFAFGAAIRAKLWMERQLREPMSGMLLRNRRSASAAELER